MSHLQLSDRAAVARRALRLSVLHHLEALSLEVLGRVRRRSVRLGGGERGERPRQLLETLTLGDLLLEDGSRRLRLPLGRRSHGNLLRLHLSTDLILLGERRRRRVARTLELSLELSLRLRQLEGEDRLHGGALRLRTLQYCR